MLVLVLVAAALVAASSAWPSEDFQPTEAYLQEEMDYKDSDAIVDQNLKEVGYKNSEMMYDPNPAHLQVFGHLKLTVPTLKIGQSIEVVYINPPIGALSMNLVTEAGDVALHFNPRYSPTGGYLVLNTGAIHGGWHNEIHPAGYPFPASNVRTRVTARITVQANGFLISGNGINIAHFPYRAGLSYNTVRHITWITPANTILESMKVTY